MASDIPEPDCGWANRVAVLGAANEELSRQVSYWRVIAMAKGDERMGDPLSKEAIASLIRHANTTWEGMTGRVSQQEADRIADEILARIATKRDDQGVREATIEECARLCEGTGWLPYAGDHAPTKACAIAIRKLATTGEPK